MKNLKIVISLFVGLFLGVYIGVSKSPPYTLLKNIYSDTLLFLNYKNIGKIFEECEIPEIDRIPSKSIAIIGHAYGSNENSNANSFIDLNLENFLKKNVKNFENIIFTGDVFKVPSSEKWRKLEKIGQNKSAVHISPGNHDIGRPDSRDVFMNSVFGKNNFPYLIDLQGQAFIIDDSTTSKGAVSNRTLDLINNNGNGMTKIIARHHVPFLEILALSNDSNPKTKALSSFKEFARNIKTNEEIIWIIGDSGATKKTKSSSCFKKNNQKFILNGIGGIEGDTILIFHDKDLFRYRIN